MTARDPRIDAILEFWFGPPGGPQDGMARPEWFRKDDAFDAVIRARFGPLLDEAAAGALDAWADDDDGALALLLVCDQFPRNLFRGEARAFALDSRAREVARRLVAEARDRTLSGVRRAFVYLPFEHAESLADQDEAVRLFGLLRDDPQAGGYLEWAIKHREVIARFGRFPHRNDALGRVSTAEEIAFLAQPGSRF
jgi:uncharacterized protein (DUF924 family)